LSAASLPYYWYLAYLSYPAADRPVYPTLEGGKVRTILEIGIGGAIRTHRMFEVALRHRPAAELAYYGIDLFEDRPARDGLPLKKAYCDLRATGIRCRLIPGDPYSALARTANEIRNVDLAIVSADQDAESLAKAWKYFARVMSPTGVVLAERVTGGVSELRPIGLGEIARLAQAGKPATAAPLRRAA
jgi:hypothetical protein